MLMLMLLPLIIYNLLTRLSYVGFIYAGAAPGLTGRGVRAALRLVSVAWSVASGNTDADFQQVRLDSVDETSTCAPRKSTTKDSMRYPQAFGFPCQSCRRRG